MYCTNPNMNPLTACSRHINDAILHACLSEPYSSKTEYYRHRQRRCDDMSPHDCSSLRCCRVQRPCCLDSDMCSMRTAFAAQEADPAPGAPRNNIAALTAPPSFKDQPLGTSVPTLIFVWAAPAYTCTLTLKQPHGEDQTCYAPSSDQQKKVVPVLAARYVIIQSMLQWHMLLPDSWLRFTYWTFIPPTPKYQKETTRRNNMLPRPEALPDATPSCTAHRHAVTTSAMHRYLGACTPITQATACML